MAEPKKSLAAYSPGMRDLLVEEIVESDPASVKEYTPGAQKSIVKWIVAKGKSARDGKENGNGASSDAPMKGHPPRSGADIKHKKKGK